MKRLIAAALAAAILLLSPGPLAYQAAAQVVRPVAVETPMGGGAPGGFSLSAPGVSAGPSLQLSSPLGASLPGALPAGAPGATGAHHAAPDAVAPLATSPAAAKPAAAVGGLAPRRAIEPAPAGAALSPTAGSATGPASAADLPREVVHNSAASGGAVDKSPPASPAQAAQTPGRFPTLRGQAHSLGMRFEELKAAFRTRSASDGGETPATGGEAGRRPAATRLQPADAEPRSVSGDAGPADAAPSPAEPAPEAPSSGKVKLPRSLWGLFWGHHVLTIFGINLHMVSQPFLVMQTLGESKALMGVVRNVHMGAMGLVNMLPIGLLLDKTDFRTIFIATSLARAALMGLIPHLLLTGHLTFAVLVAIVALNPLFQSTMVVADRVALKVILGKDEKLNKEATATLSKYDALAGMVLPILAGYAVGALVTSFGLGGYAIAYGVYAAMLLAAVPVYWLMVRDPRDHKEMGLRGFLEFLGGTGKFLAAVGKSLFWDMPLALVKLPFKLIAMAWRRIRHGAAQHAGAGQAGENIGWKERLARSLGSYEATKGVAYILRNKTLSVLMMVGAIEAFLADAMPMVVLPNFITDAIGEAGSSLPFLGSLLATAGGIFGLMLAAQQAGRFLSSWRMEGDKGDRLIAKWGHGRFYRLAAVGSLLFWLMWLFPALLTPGMFWANLGVVLAVQFGIQLLHAPVGIVMAPVVRNEIPDDMLGRVDSAFNMVNLVFMAGGALLAGFVVDLLSIHTAMFLIAIAITATAAMEWLVPRLIFPDGNHPAKKTAVPPSNGGTAWLLRPSAGATYA